MTPHTKAFGFLALLIKQGVCGTRYAQTVLDEIPLPASVAQLSVKGMENPRSATITSRSEHRHSRERGKPNSIYKIQS
jgi:hypothetical protein